MFMQASIDVLFFSLKPSIDISTYTTSLIVAAQMWQINTGRDNS
jgi:hypothetical protein